MIDGVDHFCWKKYKAQNFATAQQGKDLGFCSMKNTNLANGYRKIKKRE